MTTNMLNNLEYVDLSNSDIIQSFDQYDNDIHIRSATSILLQSLLSGGIRITHSDHEATEEEADWDNKSVNSFVLLIFLAV